VFDKVTICNLSNFIFQET